MSLVVARALASRIHMIADMEITGPGVLNDGSIRQALKAVLIDRGLCVCFAGNYDRARTAIKRVHRLRQENKAVDEILEFLLTTNVDGAMDTGLLVAISDDHPELIRIASSSIERHLPAAWVGDAEAFEQHQMIYHEFPSDMGQSEPVDADIQAVSKMEYAFGQLLARGSVATVGPPSISVDSTPCGFEYGVAAAG